MNEGRPVRHLDHAVDRPEQSADGERAQDGQDRRQAEDVAEIIHRPPGQADNRADRQVEMAGDHEQGDAYGDNPVLRGQARDVDAIIA